MMFVLGFKKKKKNGLVVLGMLGKTLLKIGTFSYDYSNAQPIFG